MNVVSAGRGGRFVVGVYWGTGARHVLRWVVPLWVCANMLTSDWSEAVLDGLGFRALEESKAIVMNMNVGWSVVGTHEFLECCARGEVAVAFVGECWGEEKTGVGK